MKLLLATTAVASTLASLALAHPLERRAITYTTEWKTVLETDVVYATVWVYPNGADFSATSLSDTTTTLALASSKTALPVPVHTSDILTSTYEPPVYAPKPTTLASTPLASTTTKTPPPAPTSVYIPPPKPASTSTPTTPTTTSPIPPTSSSGLAAPGMSYVGDLTYYATGLGSCGITSGYSDHIVAISHLIMDDPQYYTANPNVNPLCGKTVAITFDGVTWPATVVDRCVGCAQGDLDLSEGFFSLVTNNAIAEGRIPGVHWDWVD